MQVRQIAAEAFFAEEKNLVCIDVRTRKEFDAGHIADAVNIPILDEKEREKVGIVYKEQGQIQAKKLGLQLVSAKLPDFVEKIREYYTKKCILTVCCWRGGMRSKAVVAVLELMGITAAQVVGGYKAYRKIVFEKLNEIDRVPEIIMVCGSTGTGKTTILNMLKAKGYPVIDLEKLANHRGSVFGKIGIEMPNNAHIFEMNLLKELLLLKDSKYILVECESKRIGNVYIPDVLFAAMQKSKKILLKADIAIRAERLIDEYELIGFKNKQEIIDSIKAIEKRVGSKKTKSIMDSYLSGRMSEAVQNILEWYYDPLYGYEIAKCDNYETLINADDFSEAVISIEKFLYNSKL